MEKSKLNVCQEWFFSSKKEDKVEFDFLLYPEDELSDIKYGKISNENILDILGEDNKEGLVQQLCNYTDWYLEQAVDNFEATKKRLWDEYDETKHNLKTAEKELSNPKCKCAPYQIPMSALTLLNGNQTKESIFWNWKYIEEQTKGLTDPNQKKIVAEMFKAIHLVVNEYNRICKKIMAKGKIIKHEVSQEGILDLFKKKEKEKPVSKWNFYTLYIYVKFYNKNFISLYKKAGKEYADIVKKMVTKYYKWKDYEMPGYDKARVEFEKEVKDLCGKLLVSNKPLFDKTRNILKGVCDGADKLEYPLAADAWVSDGGYNPESRGHTFLNVLDLTKEDVYTVWGSSNIDVKFKNIPVTTQKVILNQLLKEVKDVIEPGTDIFVPTGNCVDDYNSGKYGEYEDGIPNDIIPNMLYNIDDQGEYLSEPDTDKEELEMAIQQCLDGLSISQEEYDIATEMTFMESVKGSLIADSGRITSYMDDCRINDVINRIKTDIMPKFFSAYNDIVDDIQAKFHNNLKDTYVFAKEIAKRYPDFTGKVKTAIANATESDIDRAKKALADIKGNKYKFKSEDDWEKDCTTIQNMNAMAKYEYEFGNNCKPIDIMLIVKILREFTKNTIKNHNGAAYGKVLKDLKEFMNNKVHIQYETHEGNIVKTVKI